MTERGSNHVPWGTPSGSICPWNLIVSDIFVCFSFDGLVTPTCNPFIPSEHQHKDELFHLETLMNVDVLAYGNLEEQKRRVSQSVRYGERFRGLQQTVRTFIYLFTRFNRLYWHKIQDFLTVLFVAPGLFRWMIWTALRLSASLNV